MIPNIIHYCWFGGNPLPTDVKKCIESWKEKCPDYEIKCWDESNFDVNAHPFTKAAYEAKAWAFVSDYARLKVVYDNGGIYLDTDVELLKNLDFLLSYEGYIGVQQAGCYCTTGLGFGAVKESKIVKLMLDKYNLIKFNEKNKKDFACPYLNDAVLKDVGYVYNENDPVEIDGFLILPPRYLDPVAPGKRMKMLKCDDTISIHHYSASWMGNKTKIKRKIIRFIGQENINKMRNILKDCLKGKQ